MPKNNWADKNHMIKLLKELRTTIVATVLAVALILTAALTSIDVVKLDLKLLDGVEKYEVDDILSGLTLIFAGLLIDRILAYRRKRHQADIEAQKLRALQATMRTVHDIVNNFLNNLLLFEDGDSLAPVQVLIQETHRKLKALGDVESVQEKPLAIGVGIEYPENGRIP